MRFAALCCSSGKQAQDAQDVPNGNWKKNVPVRNLRTPHLFCRKGFYAVSCCSRWFTIVSFVRKDCTFRLCERCVFARCA